VGSGKWGRDDVCGCSASDVGVDVGVDVGNGGDGSGCGAAIRDGVEWFS
jgi:hypothetical protein